MSTENEMEQNTTNTINTANQIYMYIYIIHKMEINC